MHINIYIVTKAEGTITCYNHLIMSYKLKSVFYSTWPSGWESPPTCI